MEWDKRGLDWLDPGVEAKNRNMVRCEDGEDWQDLIIAGHPRRHQCRGRAILLSLGKRVARSLATAAHYPEIKLLSPQECPLPSGFSSSSFLESSPVSTAVCLPRGQSDFAKLAIRWRAFFALVQNELLGSSSFGSGKPSLSSSNWVPR